MAYVKGLEVEQMYSHFESINEAEHPTEEKLEVPEDTTIRDTNEELPHERYREKHEKYYWQLDSANSEDFKEFRSDSSQGEKRLVSQTMGESKGDEFVKEVLDYDEVLSPDAKFDSFPQGFDAVYNDSHTGMWVIAEFKGQDSRLSKAQKKIHWTSDVCEKIDKHHGNYANAGDFEWKLARDIKKEMEYGNVRYEVIRTKFDEKTGQMYTVIEDRKYLP